MRNEMSSIISNYCHDQIYFGDGRQELRFWIVHISQSDCFKVNSQQFTLTLTSSVGKMERFGHLPYSTVLNKVCALSSAMLQGKRKILAFAPMEKPIAQFLNNLIPCLHTITHDSCELLLLCCAGTFPAWSNYSAGSLFFSLL